MLYLESDRITQKTELENHSLIITKKCIGPPYVSTRQWRRSHGAPMTNVHYCFYFIFLTKKFLPQEVDYRFGGIEVFQ